VKVEEGKTTEMPVTTRVQSSFMAQLKAKTANAAAAKASTETAAHAALTSPRTVAPTPRGHHPRPSVVIVPYVSTSSFHSLPLLLHFLIIGRPMIGPMRAIEMPK
jgi:hypothetical protein